MGVANYGASANFGAYQINVKDVSLGHFLKMILFLFFFFSFSFFFSLLFFSLSFCLFFFLFISLFCEHVENYSLDESINMPSRKKCNLFYSGRWSKTQNGDQNRTLFLSELLCQ